MARQFATTRESHVIGVLMEKHCRLVDGAAQYDEHRTDAEFVDDFVMPALYPDSAVDHPRRPAILARASHLRRQWVGAFRSGPKPANPPEPKPDPTDEKLTWLCEAVAQLMTAIGKLHHDTGQLASMSQVHRLESMVAKLQGRL